MYQAGILCLKDVYNKDLKQFYKYAEIQAILPGKYKYLEYYWLVTSIPKHWLWYIRDNNTDVTCFTTLFDFIKNNATISRFMYKQLLVEIIDVDCPYDFVKLWASEINVPQDPGVQRSIALSWKKATPVMKLRYSI